MKQAPGRLFALLSASLLLAAGAASTAGATTVPDDTIPDSTVPDGVTDHSGPIDDTVIVVLDEGKGDERFDLQPDMVVGTIAHAVETTTIAGTLELTGTRAFDATVDTVTTIEERAEVVAVDPDGGFTIVRTVDSYEFVVNEGPPEVADGFKSSEELEVLVGIELTMTFDADGRLISILPPATVTVSPDQQTAIDTLLDEGGDLPPFPDLDVGVGAVWTAQLPGRSAAGGDARYELVSIESGIATVEVAFDGDPESLDALLPPDFDEITGEFAGSGTLTASVENPLDSTVDFSVHIDVAMSGEIGELTMVLDATTVRVVTVAA